MSAFERALTETHAFMLAYQDAHYQRPPSFLEIMAGTSARSTETVWYRLQRLAEHGLVRLAPGLSRGAVAVRPVTPCPPVESVPFPEAVCGTDWDPDRRRVTFWMEGP